MMKSMSVELALILSDLLVSSNYIKLNAFTLLPPPLLFSTGCTLLALSGGLLLRLIQPLFGFLFLLSALLL